MALKSIKDAASAWGVSVYTARRVASADLVATVRVGRRLLIPENEIARIELTGVPLSRRVAGLATAARAVQLAASKRGGQR
jgi:hypothetical protein